MRAISPRNQTQIKVNRFEGFITRNQNIIITDTKILSKLKQQKLPLGNNNRIFDNTYCIMLIIDSYSYKV